MHPDFSDVKMQEKKKITPVRRATRQRILKNRQ